MIDGRALEADLDEQYRALSARVAASGLYAYEPVEFLVACGALSTVGPRLGVKADLGSVTTPESRNVVRKVRLEDGSLGVLKISGNTRELGEAESLASWHAAGLPCVALLDSGYETAVIAGRKTVATYVLTRYVADPPLVHPDGLTERLGCVEALVRFVRPFHETAASRWERTWFDRLAPHLRWTLPPLRDAGLELPKRWYDKLAWLSRIGNARVHGDPAGSNVLVGTGGTMTLLDPIGSLRALPEADVGRICFQVGRDDAYAAAIDTACLADRSLHPGFVACLTGLNFLTSAGYFLAGHTNPDTDPAAKRSASSALDLAAKWLGIAATLVDELSLDDDRLAARGPL